MFPSPYGVTVIKSENNMFNIRVTPVFPSPYGVTVIKSYEVQYRKHILVQVSVPLRGNGN